MVVVDCGVMVVVCCLCCGVRNVGIWYVLCAVCSSLLSVCYVMSVFAMCVDVRSVLFVVCRVVRAVRRFACCLSFVVWCW